jgi:hypothetical protein
VIILIDVMEQHPWTFSNIRADADRGGQIIDVQTQRAALGPSFGDYSVLDYQGRCHLERKSVEDAHGTILGWGERRDRFQRELENLSTLECSAVVVECSLQHLIATAPSHGKKSSGENAKILFRQVLAWQQDFRVPWLFCDGRRMAEIATFRILERFWRNAQKAERAEKRAEKQEAKRAVKNAAALDAAQLTLMDL